MNAPERLGTPRPLIVVADGFTANPGDLSWGGLAALGELTVHERCGRELLLARCKGAEIVLTNKELFDRATLAALPKLRFISVLATGTNVVDLGAAREQGVVVSNVPAYSTASVAEHTFALLFALNNRIAEHNLAARDGRWSQSGHFSFPQGPIAELHGQSFGIVGFGTIGRNVAIIARAFGMRVLAAASSSGVHTARDAELGVTRLPLDELFAAADVLSLHCPLNEQTRGLVDAHRLQLMKPSALLLNTSRGPVVDEIALADALGRGLLRGAALDVLSEEPPAREHPLLRADNCLVTPHLAWATVQARSRLLQVSFENVRAFLAGTPQNVVSG